MQSNRSDNSVFGIFVALEPRVRQTESSTLVTLTVWPEVEYIEYWTDWFQFNVAADAVTMQIVESLIKN